MSTKKGAATPKTKKGLSTRKPKKGYSTPSSKKFAREKVSTTFQAVIDRDSKHLQMIEKVHSIKLEAIATETDKLVQTIERQNANNHVYLYRPILGVYVLVALNRLIGLDQDE